MSQFKVVKAEPTTGGFNAAFVVPIPRDGHALLTKEKVKVRAGQSEIKYGMLGGKVEDGESDFQCMAREAKEESGGALSDITIARIAEGSGVIDGGPNTKVYYDRAKSFAVKHDLVVPVDADVSSRFDATKAASMRTSRAAIKKKKRAAEQVGLEFVPLDKLRDYKWRGDHMRHAASVLCARLMKGSE